MLLLLELTNVKLAFHFLSRLKTENSINKDRCRNKSYSSLKRQVWDNCLAASLQADKYVIISKTIKGISQVSGQTWPVYSTGIGLHFIELDWKYYGSVASARRV
jgi:hypothetical protein